MKETEQIISIIKHIGYLPFKLNENLVVFEDKNKQIIYGIEFVDKLYEFGTFDECQPEYLGITFVSDHISEVLLLNFIELNTPPTTLVELLHFDSIKQIKGSLLNLLVYKEHLDMVNIATAFISNNSAKYLVFEYNNRLFAIQRNDDINGSSVLYRVVSDFLYSGGTLNKSQKGFRFDNFDVIKDNEPLNLLSCIDLRLKPISIKDIFN